MQRPLIGKDVSEARKRGEVSPVSHFQRVFVSVPKAIQAAETGNNVYRRDEMIQVLQRLATKFDRPVLASDIDEFYRKGEAPSHRAIEREFDGMFKARRAAGIQNFYRNEKGSTRYWQKYTPEELIMQLQVLERRLGRKPTDRDINRASKEGVCASATTFAHMFGGLINAYEKAGFEQVKPRSYTDKEILAALKRLMREKGKMPTYHELVAASKASKCPAPGTIIRRIGKLADLKSKFETT